MNEIEYRANLIRYLLAEIDDLEPKDAYYKDYYCDFMNITITKENNDFKTLFVEAINDSSEDKLIDFMKRNKFLSINDDKDDIEILLKNYFPETNETKPHHCIIH